MANYGSTITFGGVTLNVISASPTKVQRTKKMKVGRTLSQASIIGIDDTQWEIDIEGYIFGASVTELGTNRAAIEALDDCDTHAYVDGIHDGTYYILPGSLSFEDTGDYGGMVYRYRMRLIED